MLAQFQNLLRSIVGTEPARPTAIFEPDDRRLAAAVLLVHAVNIDGVQAPDEMKQLHALLKERFSLEDDEVAALIATADQQEKESGDFSDFVAIVRRSYTADGRERILEMVWDILLSDKVVHEFEENMVWRLSDQLAIPAERSRQIRAAAARAHGVGLTEAPE